MAAAPAPDTGDLDVFDLLAGQLEAVEQRRARDDCRTVLVVVEYRDLEPLAQHASRCEALRGLDVLEIDATERRLERRDDVDQFVRVALGQFDVEDIDPGELLEQAALALHHRLGGERADVAQAEHRRAVGDHPDQVGARGEVGRQRGSARDLQAGVGHARRVGE